MSDSHPSLRAYFHALRTAEPSSLQPPYSQTPDRFGSSPGEVMRDRRGSNALARQPRAARSACRKLWSRDTSTITLFLSKEKLMSHAHLPQEDGVSLIDSREERRPMPLLKEKSGKNNSAVALLLIDVINDLDFDQADDLLAQALPMARRIATLKREAAQLRIPTIYVNDNFGQWKSDFRHTVEHCCAGNSRGQEISRTLRPEVSDYFVLKPKHSGFYATTLDLLLEYLKVDTLIITGIAANICVLFTANDAYMRDYRLCVPRIAWPRILPKRPNIPYGR